VLDWTYVHGPVVRAEERIVFLHAGLDGYRSYELIRSSFMTARENGNSARLVLIGIDPKRCLVSLLEVL
jgi:hypothetical protein